MTWKLTPIWSAKSLFKVLKFKIFIHFADFTQSFFWDGLLRKNREENFKDWEERKALHSGQEDSLKRGNFSMLCRQLQDVSVSLLSLNILCCVADLNDVSAIGSCFLAEIRKLHYALLSCLGKAISLIEGLLLFHGSMLFRIDKAVWGR